MGLDMDLYRFPRFKGYSAKQLVTANEYFDWEANENARKHDFGEYYGCDEKDLPAKEDMDYLRSMRKTEYWDWDEQHRYPHERFYENVAYWRKANAVHKWFAEHVQDGVDDCRWSDEVTEELLEELRDACRSVLESAVLVKGKVTNGWRIIDGKEVPIYEDGKLVLNAEVCQRLLPTESGFFFGNTEYNQWYIDDVKYTFDVCNKILAETDFDTQMIVYTSSW